MAAAKNDSNDDGVPGDGAEAVRRAMDLMNSGSNFFDVTIVCTTDDHQASYWMDRFRTGLLKKKPGDGDGDSSASSPYPMVLAVSEDWNDTGGAGNGLGTLYAYRKAVALAQQLYRVDLDQELRDSKISASLYHTAGKGTRMAPMPASENNNKPGVKLPFPLKVAGDKCRPLTVLEAVVKQTGIYAARRRGRLSVFWGDQVFVPSHASFLEAPTHHADILCTLGDAPPSPEVWNERGLEKYGVVVCIDNADGGDSNGKPMEAAQLEKVSHATAVSMIESFGSIAKVGPSLGSFSVSAPFLRALCDEYAPELAAKTGKYDTDPHFWMPLTLPEPSYVQLMGQKGVSPEEAKQHYARMSRMKSKFDLGGLGLFGAVNVGSDACWWDYGQLKLYSSNCLLLLEGKGSESANLLRRFLGLSDGGGDRFLDSDTGAAAVDDRSYVFGSRIKSGTVTDSLLNAVAAGEISADGAIVVNCAAKKIVAAKGSILYNLIDDSDEGIVAAEGQVMVSVTDESGSSTVLRSRMDIDGGKAWKTKLECNPLSFEEVNRRNHNADIGTIAQKRQENYDKVVASIGFEDTNEKKRKESPLDE